MNWFKELGVLIKMLRSNPNEKDDMEVVVMKHFPFSGYSAMMWCGCIVTRKQAYEVKEQTRRHERIHLLQARYMGSWVKYYLKYVWEWLKGDIIWCPASSAYYTIPFEMEAYGNDWRDSYTPTPETTKRYDIKDRKETYKKNSDRLQDWRDYCSKL